MCDIWDFLRCDTVPGWSERLWEDEPRVGWLPYGFRQQTKIRRETFFFLSLCDLLGIPVVCEKTQSSTCIIFLGITLDTINMEARLPQDKLDKCLYLINTYRCLNKISIKQLESLTVLLNFACKVVHPGRPFIRRLYSLLEGFRWRVPFFKIRLTAGAKEDLRMWDLFLQQYNSITLFLPSTTHSQHSMSIQMATNDTGWAILKSNTWAKGTWGSMFDGKLSSLLKGMVPFIALVHVFGPELAIRNCIFDVRRQK